MNLHEPGFWQKDLIKASPGAAAQSFYDHAMELSTTTEFGLLDVPAEAGQGSSVAFCDAELT